MQCFQTTNGTIQIRVFRIEEWCRMPIKHGFNAEKMEQNDGWNDDNVEQRITNKHCVTADNGFEYKPTNVGVILWVSLHKLNSTDL